MIKNILITSILIIGLTVFSNSGFAQENDWEQEYVQALQQARIKTTNQYSGLGYPTNDTSALDNAIKNAMALSAPPGEVIKIAVDLGYSPYSVIKKVLSYGGEIDLNQLCMYANQSDINKQVLAKAATDARLSTGLCNPIYSSEDIAQAQCLKEIGLGYTPVATAAPGRISAILAAKDPKPFSASSL